MIPGSYTAALIIDKTVTLHAHGATLNTTAGPLETFDVDGGEIRLLGLTVINANVDGIGIRCQPPQGVTPLIVLDEVYIETDSTTMLLQGCSASIVRTRLRTRTPTDRTVLVAPISTVTMDQSVVDGGDGVFVEGKNSAARITNSVFKNLAGPSGAFAGSNLFGAGAGSVFVQFSTVVNSRVRCGGALPACAGGTAVGSCIANSLIFNGSPGAPADTVEPGCVANYTLVFPQSTALDGSNNQYGVNPMFKDFAGADYHLAPGSPAIDAADPAASNSSDYDGIIRPQGPRSDIGAFEFKP